MKNLKKLAVAAVVAVMAIGFSAFTNANKYAGAIYYQLESDVYTKSTMAPPGDCDPLQPVTHGCTITYTVDPGPTITEFDYADRPANGSESTTKNLWSE